MISGQFDAVIPMLCVALALPEREPPTSDEAQQA